MSIIGIGLKLALTTLLYSVIIVVLNDSLKFDFRINAIPFKFLITVGSMLIIFGVPFLIISIITINKAYKFDSLCTKGVYAVCRHPLYSSWIIFIVPGIMLFFNSWILLTVPIVMYFIFTILIKQEESFLQSKFGENYKNYKNKVPLLFPMFWRYYKETNIK